MQSELTAVLDLDGVILKTNLTKHRAMLALFDSFPDHKEQISRYILDRNGIRRDLKILGIHSELLGSPLTDAELQKYLYRYAVALEEELSVAPLVEGVDRFIENHSGKLFVSSSAPSGEVERQLRARSLLRHFEGVFTGEADKRHSLEKICNLAGGNNVVFFGDSIGDWESAQSARVGFVGVVAERDNFRDAQIPKIRDFTNSAKVAAAIEISLISRTQ